MTMRKLGRIAVLVTVVLLVLAGTVWADEGPEATCPEGQVKFEVDGEYYDYTDGSVTIVATEQSVCWETTPGYTLTALCIKTGGPEGGTLISVDNPEQKGCLEGFDFDVSHVVAYTGEPSTITLSIFETTGITHLQAVVVAILFAIAIFLGAGFSAYRRISRRRSS